ncbi:MAG: 4-(cytidine 5'-diphospho)-2-C-methyl-D-erythritol kinase [Chitinophagaceae bacterium]|nr:4-(cytidine 5'-diphospho)-2-C-methyl-D-erythritol kinase [Chitinophagaceae bacterium]MBL0202639.1 4-(cytidine 5'-diphospho)-2-C-methyl-D-erythritol kinase [Chitinophagaceae bacterium]
MLSFPNCKINLGLHILGKRDDGFHNLETVFYPVPFKDALELIPSTNTGIEFTATGLAVDGNAADNLCIKAYHLLKKDFPEIPTIKIHLHKAIPLGAGLGGGSADAAFMLKLLNEKFKLNLSTDQLINYALQLGSDCPFFIINKPCLATGRGEMLEEIAVDLSAYKIVLINPGIHINTGWAFSNISPAQPARSIKEIIHQPVNTWKDELKNDFESAVFTAHPAIKEIKETLYSQGAVYAAMSGSGSTVFGIFEPNTGPVSLKDSNYFIKIIN